MSFDLSSLFSNVWAVFLVVLFFGGTIFVHELGHFLAARRRGVHVERFSIGFGPAIFSWRGRDNVEYRLSWIPLGGYVLLPQLADLGPIEGETTSDVSKLPPVSYTSRIIVFVAGAFFNMLFAFLLATILWIVGITVSEEEQTTRIEFVRPTIEVAPGQHKPGPAFVAGLREKDVIVAVDGKSVRSFSDINSLIALGGGRDERNHPQVDITYLRDGQQHTTSVLPELVGPDEIRDIGAEPAWKVTVGGIVQGSPAEQVGMKPNDVLIELDGEPINYASYVSDQIRKGEGRAVELKILRDGHPLTLHIQPKLLADAKTKVESYRLGLVDLHGAMTPKLIHVAPWTQIQQTVLFTWRNLISVLNPHSDVGLKKMSGTVGIIRTFHAAAEAGLVAVFWFTILINVNLAIFNLLPIPVLDGGQIVFATIARLRGRSLPVPLIAATQGIFMVLILMMFVYITIAGDIPRAIRDAHMHAEMKAQQARPPAPAGATK